MKIRKLLVFVAILTVLLGGFSSGTARADWSKVDQRVLDQLDTGGMAQFHVVMAKQADVSGAALLDTKLEKTTFVYNLLTRTASQTQAPLLSFLRTEGIEYKSHYIYNAIEVTAGRSTVEWLASRKEVARIVSLPNPQKEPVFQNVFGPQLPTKLYGPSQPGEAVEWNITRVKAPVVWDMGFRGEGMVVGDNDTGVEFTHPALVNQYRGNLGGGNYDHNYNWWDAWGGAPSPVPVDYDGHGTHTMGTMVGDDGGANQIGVAPGAQWIACAGLNLECLEFFLAPWDLNHQNPDPSKAPDAINNSWYDPSGYDYRPIILNLNAAGIAVIKSAGNLGPGCSTISNPGYVPEIIATAAFAQGDTIANFSSRGPMNNYGDVILKPEVAAPGVNIRSSVPGGGYDGSYSGTSMAAPHSTGLVTLIWSAAPCLKGDVPTTKQIMMDTAEAKIDAQCVPFVDHPNDVWGWGILDAQAAVDYAIGYCGGLGTLQGTVTDVATGSPIQDVNVRAAGSSGYNKVSPTDGNGFYSMNIPADTYTVTASVYGYATSEAYPVEVVSDLTTIQDFALAALPVYTVSGYVKETGTNLPLVGATLEFTDGIPVAPVTTDGSGYYTIAVAQGTWNLKASADSHLPQTQEIVVNDNTTADFFLDPLPCILLVDDDQNGPDVRSYYTAALDNLGYEYNIWDVSAYNDPAESDLFGYKHVLWFTGYPYAGTFSSANEAAVGAYLDAGGNFFLSGQDYLYDAGLTPFGQSYLHIASFTSDVSQTTVTGQNVYSGLGPYSLTYPFTNYSDRVTPDAQAQLAFLGNQGNAAVSYAGASFNTVFFGYPFEAISQLANRADVMERTVEFFGGCEPPDEPIEDLAAENNSPTPLGETTTLTATVTGGSNIWYEWDFGDGTIGTGATITHVYPAVGGYTATVTATNSSSTATATTLVTITDLPIVGLAAANDSPTLLGGTTTFTATITGGTNAVFTWDFGDGITLAGQVVEHVYASPGEYTVTVTATNSLGFVSAETVAFIEPLRFYLPFTFK